LITVVAADGTTQQIDVTIHGANDAAVIGGDTTGSVTEKGGVSNGTPGVATATGTLTATDVDSAATFVSQTNAAKSFGTFSIEAGGVWSYALADSNVSVQALLPGALPIYLITVVTADGTTQQIDIAVHGANDAAVITGTTTGSVTEKGGINNGTPGV